MTIDQLLLFECDKRFEVRGAREQVHRQHFLDAIAVTFPFGEGAWDFVSAAENVEHTHGLAHRESPDDARFSAFARRVQQNAFRFARDRPRKSHLHKRLVNFPCDELVVLLQESSGCLRAIDGRTFPFHTENGFGGFTECKAEETVTAVKIQEMVALFETEQAACGLDEVVDLAFVNLAESRHRVLEPEMAEVERKFARAVKLLEVERVCRALGFEIVVGTSRVYVGMCCGYVVRALLQDFGNLLELAHDACVQLFHVENHDAVLVRAADDEPVERVGEWLVGWRDELVEQQAVNGVVFFGLQNAIVFVKAEVARLHFDLALGRRAVIARHGASHDWLRTACKAVDFPKFADGFVLDLKFVLVIERSEGLAVSGIGFLSVIREVVSDGLFKKHINPFLYNPKFKKFTETLKPIFML